jgi:hypothetical protein
MARHAAVPSQTPHTAEHARLAGCTGADSPWRLWGPYLSGRQWGTVREDYSTDGDAWSYLPFEHADRRAYRWGEDGLGGISDRNGLLNFSLGLWNGRDPILKERLFGLTNAEGNHGEDVKEYWWALDGTPTHSWMSWRYRYPHAQYPYAQLRAENAKRGTGQREYELADTGVLAQNRFFDVTISYAKNAPEDIAILIEATNHGPDPAGLHLLPQLWFRNTWAWGRDPRRPAISAAEAATGAALHAHHEDLGRYALTADGDPQLLFCENESNLVSLYGVEENPAAFTKDGIGRHVIDGGTGAVNPERTGTKAALWYRFDAVAPGATVTVRLRLSAADNGVTDDGKGLGATLDAIVTQRRAEADEFYATVIPADTAPADRHIARRAFAGLLWGKQLYRYAVAEWLDGDPGQPQPPPQRRGQHARNAGWRHLSLADVISMPDEWEYPWFAAWDLAFHCVTLAHVDPVFAKQQLLLLCRERTMHPEGQLPAYEWSFGDVNPPVHAWAAWQVYRIDAARTGERDTDFLIRICTKLLLAFGWWVNRKDADNSGLYEGGFLGMDNISLFNRSAPLPDGARLEQSDATSWMAFFCLQMLTISLELASDVTAWEELAATFLAHFRSISGAMRTFGSRGVSLWDEADGFYYDVLVHRSGDHEALRVRSMVGLLPLLAVARVPAGVAQRPGGAGQVLALLDGDRLARVLSRLFDEDEFLSPHGIRSLSAAYRSPYVTDVDGRPLRIDYEPGESTTGLFGGNSNWRGPVWFPVNVLLADALRAHGTVHGDTVELPPRSGSTVSLTRAAELLEERLIALFRPGPDGRRPADGARVEASDTPLWREHVTFSEYFDGDTGEGLGASHQTGWTALVAHLICRSAETNLMR